MGSTASRAASPVIWLLISTAGACASLGLALHFSRSSSFDAFAPTSRNLHPTPERTAEDFLDAYRRRDFERAARFASQHLASTIRAHGQPARPAAHSGDTRRWVLQESHVLPGDRLRFLGVLVRPDQDESAGWPVSLTLVHGNARYWVEELYWPHGPPPEDP